MFPDMSIYEKYTKKQLNIQDSNDNCYNTIEDLWRSHVGRDGGATGSESTTGPAGTHPGKKKFNGDRICDKDSWYSHGNKYWDNQPATIDGVCGGYGQHHAIQSAHSINVFKEFVKDLPSTGRALDAGAGIGRVTKTVLSEVFDEIDLNEQSKVQIEEAKKFVPFVKNFYNCGFQDFKFEHKYDCIWLEWFLMYLTDKDLIESLMRCRRNLTVDKKTGNSGLIIVKENIKASGCYLDREDNSLIRSPMYFKAIFDTCGLEILTTSNQPGWPKDLFSICMFVLRKKRH